MVSKNALSRKPAHDVFAGTQDSNGVAQDIASGIAQSWMRIGSAEQALMPMGRACLYWAAAPQAQVMAAAMLNDMIGDDAAVYCTGFQAYPWSIAAGISPVNVMRQYLGKTLPANIMAASAEDTAAMIGAANARGRTNIAALHVENAAQWNDVRAISAAAVKNGAPLLVVVSASTPAPEGVAIDMTDDWNQAAGALRAAMGAVREGAIRVIAINDNVSAPDMERAMMEASGMTPQAWMEDMQKNNDGAEITANAAYQSPVESF